MTTIDVTAEITGNLWKLEKAVGDQVKAQDELFIMESMKMEIPALSPVDGKVMKILVQEGDNVAEGDIVMQIEV